jgi:hypothetical protein
VSQIVLFVVIIQAALNVNNIDIMISILMSACTVLLKIASIAINPFTAPNATHTSLLCKEHASPALSTSIIALAAL